MQLQIFDVEHGACALATCDDNSRLMIDCGQNGLTGWRPGNYLYDRQIYNLDMLAITNYDEDHVAGLPNLFDRGIDIQWLWRNKSVTSQTIRKLKSEDGMGAGIAKLVDVIDNVFTAGTGGLATPQPSFAGMTRKVFYNDYPAFDDENNLSMVVHLNCHGVGMMFPGDLERAGWLKLLEQEDFREALKNTHVLVASHHGRENGCCEEIFHYCKPYYVVISDKGYMYDTQETIPFYRRFTRSGAFRGATRNVLTTRKDGMITFAFNHGSWGPY
ncbi:hypothetical protein [Mesorhizobium sp. M1D.F.Ca.ET.043.01.1.1]|uniref:ComEC/Rec2 family competence protein n=1 Tax=Mesorhizobium sp. M1D.F.Ca.ET.043.01.1.1 TaxID=2493669 RepID=UPI000F76427E|nr:hypothetical protein [Mesorhizobium sp. M1D.F.Ca.ET.043.01.1.1]AZO69954.1 hypothetical protein EJ067_01210 [Mesorhizobium sp. M1D.F.Ca.ET.043.01.1.1]